MNQKLFSITKSRLMYICASLLLVTSCQEDNVFNKEGGTSAARIKQYTPQQITDAPYEDQKLYALHHLGVLSQALLSVTNNERFRQILYREINKKELDESAVLFSSLFKTINQQDTSLLSEMQHSVSSEEFINSQKAFWGIEEEILFPQIYVPFYEQVRAKSVDNPHQTGNLPIVVVDPIENAEVVKGYQMNEYGQILTLDGIDESYAREHEVWVVSINESIKVPTKGYANDCASESPLLCYPENANHSIGESSARLADVAKAEGTCTRLDGNTGNAKRNTSGRGIDVYVDRVTVKIHKEPWYAGQSEVWMGFTSLWAAGRNFFSQEKDTDNYWGGLETVGSQTYSSNTVSGSLVDVSRRNVKKKKALDLFKIQVDKWGQFRRKDAIVWVAYESDAWPAPSITYTVSTSSHEPARPGTNSTAVNIRTREATPYGGSYFNWYQGDDRYACGSRFNNNEIDISFVTRKHE